MMLYSVHDPEVRLEDIATATPVAEQTLPNPPSVKGMTERERDGENEGKGGRRGEREVEEMERKELFFKIFSPF